MPPISQEDAPLSRIHPCALQEPHPQLIIPPGILLELIGGCTHLRGPLANKNSPCANLRSGYMAPCASGSSTPCPICFLCILWCPRLHLYTSGLHGCLVPDLLCSIGGINLCLTTPRHLRWLSRTSEALSPTSFTTVINLRPLLRTFPARHSTGSKSDLMESDRSSTQTPRRSVLGSWALVEGQSPIGRFPDTFQGMGTSS